MCLSDKSPRIPPLPKSRQSQERTRTTALKQFKPEPNGWIPPQDESHKTVVIKRMSWLDILSPFEMFSKTLCDVGPSHFDLFYQVVKVHLQGLCNPSRLTCWCRHAWRWAAEISQGYKKIIWQPRTRRRNHMEAIFAKNGSETPEPVQAEVRGEFQTKRKHLFMLESALKKGNKCIYQVKEKGSDEQNCPWTVLNKNKI